jgi:hypothetical protein
VQVNTVIYIIGLNSVIMEENLIAAVPCGVIYSEGRRQLEAD